MGPYGILCSHFHANRITLIFFSDVSILHLFVAPVQLRLLLLFWFTTLAQLPHLLELTVPFLTGIFPTVIGLVVLTDLTVSFLGFVSVIVSHVFNLSLPCMVRVKASKLLFHRCNYQCCPSTLRCKHFFALSLDNDCRSAQQ